MRFGRRTLGGGAGEARRDQDGEDVSTVNQLRPPSFLPRKSRPTRNAIPDLKRNCRSCAYAVHTTVTAGPPQHSGARRLRGVARVEGKPLGPPTVQISIAFATLARPEVGGDRYSSLVATQNPDCSGDEPIRCAQIPYSGSRQLFSWGCRQKAAVGHRYSTRLEHPSRGGLSLGQTGPFASPGARRFHHGNVRVALSRQPVRS